MARPSQPRLVPQAPYDSDATHATYATHEPHAPHDPHAT
jgi:hypothetical protein